MNTIDKGTLLLLVQRDDVDSISCKAFRDEEIFLHNKGSVGIYIKGYGLVLEPRYVEIQRFDDILQVGVRNEKLVLYGGYSLVTKSFVIPPLYSLREFWTEFMKYRSIDQKATQG